jgi:hypothetical protein
VRYLLAKLLVPALWVGSYGAFAQTGKLLEMINTRLDSASARQAQTHRRLVVQFDQRYSLLQGRLVGINGFKLGVEWRSRFRMGVGGYLLSQGVASRDPLPLALPAGTRPELRFQYVAVYGEYVLIGTRRWELSTPTQLGFGRVFSNYYLPDGSRQRSGNDHIWMIEPSLAGHMRVFRWIGVGVGFGYRQMLFLDDNDNEDRQLNGIIFFGRAKLFLGDLYKVFRGHERLFSQEGLRPPGKGKR